MVRYKYIKSERRNRKWDVKGLNFIIKKSICNTKFSFAHSLFIKIVVFCEDLPKGGKNYEEEKLK